MLSWPHTGLHPIRDREPPLYSPEPRNRKLTSRSRPRASTIHPACSLFPTTSNKPLTPHPSGNIVPLVSPGPHFHYGLAVPGVRPYCNFEGAEE